MAGWVGRCNEERFHEACKYVSPAEFDQTYDRRLGRPARPRKT